MIRSENEDAWLVNGTALTVASWIRDTLNVSLSDSFLALSVADGVGGAGIGAPAARAALQHIHSGACASIDIDESLLRGLIRSCDLKLHSDLGLGSRTQGGASVGSVFLHNGHGWLVLAGDCSATLFSGSSILCDLQPPHLWQWLRTGFKPPDGCPPMPPFIDFLGTGRGLTPIVCRWLLQAGDRVVVYTDGLGNRVETPELSDVLRSRTVSAEACTHLIDTVNERGGEDNATVLIVDIIECALASSCSGNRCEIVSYPLAFVQDMADWLVRADLLRDATSLLASNPDPIMRSHFTQHLLNAMSGHYSPKPPPN